MASNQKKRCAGPSFAAVPTQLEPTIKTICVRTRSRRPRGFVSATLCSSTSRSARSSSVVIVEALKRHRFNVLTLQRLSLVDLIVLVFCPFRWWRLVAEFAVPDLAAGIGDVAASSQGHSAQQNRRDGERHRRFWPFHRRCDRNRAQGRERIENVDEVLGTILMLVEPGLPIGVGYRQNAVISLLAEFVNRPRRSGTDEYERQCSDLSTPAP